MQMQNMQMNPNGYDDYYDEETPKEEAPEVPKEKVRNIVQKKQLTKKDLAKLEAERAKKEAERKRIMMEKAAEKRRLREEEKKKRGIVVVEKTEDDKLKDKKVDESDLKEVDRSKEPCSIVFIGHVDVGKSTICGNLMYQMGIIDDRVIQKYKTEAKSQNRESWWLAYVMD